MESLPRILLISSSTVYGCDYLDHVEQQIKSFLGSARKVLFFPFALFDRDTYAAKAKRALRQWATQSKQLTLFPIRTTRLSRQMRSSLVAAIRFVCLDR